MKYILASKSPRRKEILNNLGVNYSVIESQCGEITKKTKPKDIVLDLAAKKANWVYDNNELLDCCIIAADTIVVLDDKIFGKPKDKNEAFKMIKELQNNWHTVYTGVSIIRHKNNKKQQTSYYEKTKVHMIKLDDDEIWNYIQTKEPMDKAGAYAIQGIGKKLIDKIDGEYNTVVGLPTKKLIAEFL